MLYRSPGIVSADTFQLIVGLQALPVLSEFHLVGGTSLALQMGHRNSVDIDLFTLQLFHGAELSKKLNPYYSIQADVELNGTLLSHIKSIKVDFITHNYPYVKEPVREDGITLLSKEDIAAMKLNAIIQSGQRYKDFIDIYFLLEYFSVNDMLHFFSVKYDYINPVMALKALTYFNDLDETIDAPKMVKPVTADMVKQRIIDATRHAKKVFR